MIRQSILAAGLLALVGCGSQNPSTDIGSTDQELSIDDAIRPEPWSARLVRNSDYWDFGMAAPDGAPANHQMVALVTNASDNTPDNVIGDATRMVWLVSNARVFKVYEVNAADLASMMTTMQSAFSDVENKNAATGHVDFGSKVKVGVDGGVVTKKGGGGPPHGFPASDVATMQDLASSARASLDTGDPTIFPEPWTTHKVQDEDYWDFGAAASGEAPANHQMVALVANRAASPDNASDVDSDQPTRMVWLVSNSRVYKVYEVPETDLASMMTTMQSAFSDVENKNVATGAVDFGSKVKAGVDGGVVTKKGGGGPPHGFSATLVSTMQNAASWVMAGVDGGVVTKKGGGAPPHGIPASEVSGLSSR